MDHELNLKQTQKLWHGSFKSYALGLILSFLLTSLSFYLVIEKVFERKILIYTIACLGLVQAFIQLLFFLHLGKEDKPKWELALFYFMLILLLIIVLGSLWIMFDLDERTMSHMRMEM